MSSSVAHFSFCPQSFPASHSFPMIQLFTIRWPKYWSFSFSISPSNEYSGLISLRIDWFDLFVVQGTLKSLLQHHSSKASIFSHSAFFSPTLTSIHTTEKDIALTRWNTVNKEMSLLFKTLSRCLITLLPRNKHHLISWLQSPSTVTLEPKKIKSTTVFIFPPSNCHEVIEPDAMIFVL